MTDMHAQREPVFNAPPMTVGAVGLLALIWAALSVVPDSWLWWILHYGSVVPGRLSMALEFGRVQDLALFAMAMVTHALIHVDTIHLMTNAGFLLAFGSVCERRFGAGFYVFLLIASAVAGALAQVIADWGQPALMIGASGAVSGCVGAFLRQMLGPGGNPARRRLALTLAGVLVGVNVVMAVFGGQMFGVEGTIAWEAHLGGLLAGALLGGGSGRPQPAKDRRSEGQPS